MRDGKVHQATYLFLSDRLCGIGTVLCYNEAKIPEQQSLSEEGLTDESIF